MHSRAVILLSLFGLACLVVVGSIALHLTSASASTDRASADQQLSSPSKSEAATTPLESSNAGFFGKAPDPHDPGVPAAELSPVERLSADSLEALMWHVHVKFEPEGSSVSNDMIPYLAKMITVINQHDHLVYRIEIVEPDAALARRRAQTLNDVLRLNVLEPSRLHIVGRQGLHGALVDVSAL